MLTHISVRGAREHNLKNVDIDIPRETLTVITGLSGSGKSSLAFDTIYAEGQRRYVESLSAYARQFLEMMQKPDVDHIEGLSPAISIEQKTTSRNPRSTVATVTEIYDYMRLLWARVGVPYSPATGLPISAQTVSQMVDRVMALPEGTRLYLLAPVVRGRKGEYRKELAEWQKAGFTRVRIDGEFHDIEDAPALDKKYKHDIEIVVDRIVVREGIEQRLADSFETALKLAEGLAYLDPADSKPPLPSGERDGVWGLGVSENAQAPDTLTQPSPSRERAFEAEPHKATLADLGLNAAVGDCIDCNACVAVCPTGIDIREGQQIGCITCSLCIDACDKVMTQIGRPRGLIDYTTLENAKIDAAAAQEPVPAAHPHLFQRLGLDRPRHAVRARHPRADRAQCQSGPQSRLCTALGRHDPQQFHDQHP